MGVSGENTIPEETMPIADDPDVLNDSGSDADIVRHVLHRSLQLCWFQFFM